MEIFQNLPSNYSSKIEEEKKTLLESIKSSLIDLKTTQNKHFISNLNFEIKKYTQLKYPLPDLESKEIINLLFDVLSIFQDDPITVSKMTSLLIRLLNKKQDDINLTISWELLYKLVQKNLFLKKREINKSQNSKKLIHLVKLSRKFFPEKVTEEMLGLFLPKLDIHSLEIFDSQAYLCLFLPTWNLTSVPKWFDILINAWDWIDSVPSWHGNFLSLFGRLIEDTHESGSVCQEAISEKFAQNANFLMTKLIGKINPKIGSENQLKPIETKQIGTKLFRDLVHTQITPFICYSWEATKDHLKRFIAAFESYFHPSNISNLSKELHNFVNELTKCMKKRICNVEKNKLQREEKEKQEILSALQKQAEEMFDIFFSVLYQTTYSKAFFLRLTTCAQFKIFAEMIPEYTILRIMKIIKKGFDSLEQAHQREASLLLLQNISTTLFTFQKQRIAKIQGPTLGLYYFKPFLEIILEEMNTSSSWKTFSVMFFVQNLFSFIPIIDPNDDEIVTSEDLKSWREKRNDEKDTEKSNLDAIRSIVDFGYEHRAMALMSAYEVFEKNTSWLTEWILKFIESLFLISRNVSSTPFKLKKVRISINDLINNTFSTIFTQCSERIFSKILARLQVLVGDSVFDSYIDRVSSICGIASITHPEATLEVFVPFCFERLFLVSKEVKKVEDYEKADIRPRENCTDSEIIRVLTIFSKLFNNVGKYLLPYKKPIILMVDLALKHEKKEVNEIAGKIIYNVLTSLTRYYITEYRSVPYEIWIDPHFRMNHWKYWGFDYKNYQNNRKGFIGTNWHIPSKEEVEFVEEIFQYFLSPYLQKISIFGNSFEKRKLSRKELQEVNKIFEFLSKMISGSTLYLNSFNENLNENYEIYNLNENENENENYEIYNLNQNENENENIQNNISCGIEIYPQNNWCEIITNKIIQFTFSALKNQQDNQVLLTLLVNIHSYLLKAHRIYFQNFSQTMKIHNLRKKIQKVHLPKKITPRSFHLQKIDFLHKFRLGFMEESPHTPKLNNIIANLLNFLLSQYKTIQSKSKKVLLNLFRVKPKIAYSVIPEIIQIISTPGKSRKVVLSALDILFSKNIRWKITSHWFLTKQFIYSICKSSHNTFSPIQLKITDLYLSYFKGMDIRQFIPITKENQNENQNEPFWDQYALLVSNLINFLDKNKIQQNESDEKKPIPKTTSTNINWKYNSMITSFLQFLIADYEHTSINHMEIFFKKITSEVVSVQKSAIEGINKILIMCKPIAKRITSNEANENKMLISPKIYFDEMNKALIENYPSTEEQYSKCAFYDKGWFGSHANLENIDPKLLFIYDYSVPLKFVDGFDKERFTKSVIKEEFLESLIRYSTSIQTANKEKFDAFIANVFKGLIQISRVDFFNAILPHISKLCKDEQNSSSIIVSAQIIFGILRGVFKHFSYKEIEYIWSKLKEHVETVMMHSSQDVFLEICNAVVFLTVNRDPRRFKLFIDFLSLEKLDKETDLQKTKKIAYFAHMLVNFSWKTPQLCKIMSEFLQNNLEKSNSLVRSSFSVGIYVLLESCLLDPWLKVSEKMDEAKNLEYNEIGNEFVNKIIKKFEELLKQMKENLNEKLNENLIDRANNFVSTIVHFLLISHLFGAGLHLAPRPLLVDFVKILLETSANFSQTEHEKLHENIKTTLELISNSFSIEPVRNGRSIFVEEMILFIMDYCEKEGEKNHKITLLSLSFIQIFVFNNILMISNELFEKVILFIMKLHIDKNNEVRILSGITLSGFLRYSKEPEKYKMEFEKICNFINKKSSPQLLSRNKELLPLAHGYVVFLSALALRDPYSIAKFQFDSLVELSNISWSHPIIRNSIKDTFAKFFKTHEKQVLLDSLSNDDFQLLMELSYENLTQSYFV